MHSITRKLFISHTVLLAGCATQAASTRTVSAPVSPTKSVSLAYIARRYSMVMSISGRKITMRNKWNKLELETNSRRAWINGVMVWLHKPSYRSGPGWALRGVDFHKCIDPVLRSYAFVPSKMPRMVVLDPGHGGKDPGAVGPSKAREKDLALTIAHQVRKKLESHRIPVRMTRTTDTFLTLTQRTDYAAKVGADIFISIHADGAADSSAKGVETFILTAPGCDSSNQYGQPADTSARKGNAYDAPNAVLGFSLQSNLVRMSQRSDRGMRRARFAVIKNAPCPAALVECGFLTNPDEDRLLRSAAYQDKVARGITNGILGYMTLVKRGRKKA